MNKNKEFDRRNLLKSTALFTTGTIGLTAIPTISSASDLTVDDRLNIIGPKEGFSPHVGTLLYYDDMDAKCNIKASEKNDNRAIGLSTR